MTKIKTLGIIRTSLGEYYVVPCGCEKELIPPQYKGVRIGSMVEGTYPKPMTVEFHTDYLFEDLQEEITVA